MKYETIYFFHLDELREENKITIDEFINNAVSLRQYWRYRNGESLCPQYKFTKLLTNMKLSLSEFQNYLYSKSGDEYPRMQVLYQHILCDESKKAKQIIDYYSNHNFISYETKSFYDTCCILYENKFSNHSKSSKLDSYSSFIDYPNCLIKNHVTFTDVVILQKIAEIEVLQKKRTCIDFLARMITEEKIFISGN